MHIPTNFYPNNEELPLISAESIKKSFGKIEVLEDISIKVNRSEFVALLGPSGCGKTTIFNIITGLVREDEGKITIKGTIGYMQQKDLLLPWKTIMDNVALPLILKGIGKSTWEAKVKKYLPVVDLEGYENNYPSQLSGGMRQRASFLRTLMASEDIMLLDEPFASLDSITKGNMQKWLLEMKNKLNNTILLITHDIDEAIFFSDKIYVLSQKPASVKKEISVDFCKKDKLERLLSPQSLLLKQEILGLLG